MITDDPDVCFSFPLSTLCILCLSLVQCLEFMMINQQVMFTQIIKRDRQLSKYIYISWNQVKLFSIKKQDKHFMNLIKFYINLVYFFGIFLFHSSGSPKSFSRWMESFLPDNSLLTLQTQKEIGQQNSKRNTEIPLLRYSYKHINMYLITQLYPQHFW